MENPLDKLNSLAINPGLTEILHARELSLLNEIYLCMNRDCGAGIALYANLGSWRCKCHTGYPMNGVWSCCKRPTIERYNGCVPCDHWPTIESPTKLIHRLTGDVYLYYTTIQNITINRDSIMKVEGDGNDPAKYIVYIARCKSLVKTTR
jgi:hypothetical protein